MSSLTPLRSCACFSNQLGCLGAGDTGSGTGSSPGPGSLGALVNVRVVLS